MGRLRGDELARMARTEAWRESEKADARTPIQAGWADLLTRPSLGLDVFFTLTYSDEYAARHWLYSPTSAMNDFERWVERMAYPGNYFVAAEPHYCRDVPHLHGLMESCGVRRVVFWRDWFRDRGRAKFEAPRSDAAVVYCAKYTIKRDPVAFWDGTRFRLNEVGGRSARRLRREWCEGLHISEGQGTLA